MSLESFIGYDSGEGMSGAALEQLREKMKAAAAQIAAIKKEEKKHKKKEEELLKILIKFVKTSHKKELVLLISRVLEQNITANFILAVILLGNEDVQKEVGRFLMVNSGDETALVFFREEDETLPLKIKIEVDAWIKNMLFQAEETPQKLLKHAYNKEEKSIKTVIIRLITYVLRDFLEQNKISEPYKKLSEFSEFILKGILNKTQESLDKRQLIPE